MAIGVLHQIESSITRRLSMLGFVARWGHNVLLATMGLLTIAIVIAAS
jgi:hypothetical protein